MHVEESPKKANSPTSGAGLPPHALRQRPEESVTPAGALGTALYTYQVGFMQPPPRRLCPGRCTQRVKIYVKAASKSLNYICKGAPVACTTSWVHQWRVSGMLAAIDSRASAENDLCRPKSVSMAWLGRYRAPSRLRTKKVLIDKWLKRGSISQAGFCATGPRSLPKIVRRKGTWWRAPFIAA